MQGVGRAAVSNDWRMLRFSTAEKTYEIQEKIVGIRSYHVMEAGTALTSHRIGGLSQGVERTLYFFFNAARNAESSLNLHRHSQQ